MNWEGRPYHALKVYLYRRFGFPVKRVALDAGFTCPNRDGRISYGGCFFCGEEGSRAYYVNPRLSVREQMEERMRFWRERGFTGGFIAYFQAYTNTYGQPELLRSLYESVLLERVVGVFIGTRPDCLEEDVLEVLSHLAMKTWVMVEVGVQSTRDDTLERIHRGHTAEAVQKALRDLGQTGVDRLVHVIGGLPGETKGDFLKTVMDVQEWGCEAIKFHHLFVEKGTVFEQWYREGKLAMLSREEYMTWLLEAILCLDPRIVVHRLFGECEASRLVAPLWTLDKAKNIQMFEGMMRRENFWQGKNRREGL